MEPRKKLRLLGLFGSMLGLLQGACVSRTGDDGGTGDDGSSGGMVGSGGSGTTVEGDHGVQKNYGSSYCEDGQPSFVGDIRGILDVDYVALRSTYDNGGEPTTSQIVQEKGSACSTGDQGCRDALAAPVDAGVARGAGGWELTELLHLATTVDEHVAHYFTLEEIRHFLGTIDTGSEALLLTYLSGYAPACDISNLKQEDDGFSVYAESGTTCGGNVSGHRIHVSASGVVTVVQTEVVEEGDDGCAIGRIPEGLRSAVSCADEDGIGAFWARAAHLEAASVASFERLARELRAHGAPEELVETALRSAREETRHALLTGGLARRHGAERPVPVVESVPDRTLEEIALENAVEGLVRETYGALVAHHQALHASDALTRRVVENIAVDETHHAEFSWELHEWLVARLDTAARERVEAAHRRAIDAFEESLVRESSDEVRRAAGLPTESEARRLYSTLRRELWDAA